MSLGTDYNDMMDSPAIDADQLFPEIILDATMADTSSWCSSKLASQSVVENGFASPSLGANQVTCNSSSIKETTLSLSQKKKETAVIAPQLTTTISKTPLEIKQNPFSLGFSDAVPTISSTGKLPSSTILSSSSNASNSEGNTPSFSSGSSAQSLMTSSASMKSAPPCKKSSDLVKKPIPVFDHILLLPPSFHKSSKEDSLPSNYLTPEEEAMQARQIWSRQQKRAREEKKRMKAIQYAAAYAQSSDEEYEIGRSGRKRKKPKRFADCFVDESKESESQSEDEFLYYSNNGNDDSFGNNDDIDTYADDNSVLSSEDEPKSNSFPSANLSSSRRSTNTTVINKVEVNCAKWNQQVEALKNFKKLHGHTRVSQRNAQNRSLARWVKKVREKYKKVQKGQSVPSLTPKRIAELNAIGFVWAVRSSDFNMTFESHLADLLEFKRQNGHTRVPHVYDENPKLGRWCHHIKLTYNKLKKGEKPMIKLNQEQLDKLDEIGFQWKTRYVVASRKDKNKYDFDQGFMKLKAFQTMYGHCGVPDNFSNQNLVHWINTIKSSYRQISEGKRPIMRLTGHQISLLNEMKFDWVEKAGFPNFYKSPLSCIWSAHYEHLCAYKARYGNCRVPSRYDDDKAFGNWVNAQRKALGQIVVGKGSALTNEQRRKLEDIGLEWTVYHYDTDTGNVPKWNTKTSETPLIYTAKSGEKLEKKKRKEKPSQTFLQPESKRQKANIDDWIKELDLGFKWKKEYRTRSINIWCRKLNLGFKFDGFKECDSVKYKNGGEQSTKRFKKNIEELRLYKAENGHCNVTAKQNKFLNAWMSNIKTSYKRIQEGKMPLIKLTDDRIQDLKDLGFDFRKNIRLKNTEPKLSQLFKEENNPNQGLTLAPKLHSHVNFRAHDASMEDWCKSLNLKFTWNHENMMGDSTSKSSPEVINQEVFDSYMERLKASKVKNGHTKVNMKVFKSMSSRELMHQKVFDSYVEELKVFKAQHGHMNVSIKENKSLSTWVQRIRTSYNKIQAGLQPPVQLSDARLSRLDAIGFDFRRQSRSIRFQESAYLPSAKLKSSSFDTNKCYFDPLAPQDISDWCKELRLGFIWNKGDKGVDYSRHEEAKLQSNCNQMYEGKFKAKLEDLKAFKELHGHFDVTPSMDKSLNNWISNLRMTYKRVREGKSPLIKLTEERLQSLIDIGFDFRTSSIRREDKSEPLDLDTLIVSPHASSANSMKNWCINLNLGFKWSTNGTQKPWSERNFNSKLNELKSFIAIHGHMNVPVSINKSLNYWISNVKSSYKRIQEGKSPLIHLTDYRIDALREVGFDFMDFGPIRSQNIGPSRRQNIISNKASQPSRKKNMKEMQSWCNCLGLGFEWENPSQSKAYPKPFDQHLEELRLYKQKRGSKAKIAQIEKHNKPLSNWCRNVQSSYSRMLKEENSPKGLNLTTEKIEKIKEAGLFDFDSSRQAREDNGSENKDELQANPIREKSQMVTFFI